MKPAFIALEGLPGVGKTTIAAELAAAIGADQLPTVPAGYDALRRSFHSADELDARYLCFLSAVSRAERDIRRHLRAGHRVVVDSYLARTVAFHRGMGSTIQVRIPALRMPDAAFHLTCAPAERARRLHARGGPRDRWDTLAAEHEAAIVDEYRRFPMHTVDTTTRTPQQVVAALLDHPFDRRCDCAHPQPLAGHQDLLPAAP